MGEQGDQCTVCFTGALQLHEGMLVCDVCGSIFQGYAEELQEYQTGISDARFFKKSEGMKSKARDQPAAEAEPPPSPPVAEAVQSYLLSIQQLLKCQAEVLVTTFGMDPALRSVVRELWLAYLTHSRLLEPATLLKLEGLADPSAAPAGAAAVGGGKETEERGGNSMPGQMTHSRRSLRIQAELAPVRRKRCRVFQVLHPRHTLALLLLACWHQLEAAGPLDVLHWALDGQLPYLSFAADAGEPLQQYRNILGRELITVKGVPSPRALYISAADVAQKLGLSCPPLSPALWLQRYLAELELPQELLPVVLQLHSLYHPAPLVPTAAIRPNRNPWAQLMASLVLAVKLCYGMDGTVRRMQGLPPPPAWSSWAPRQLSRLSRLSAFPLSLNEAAQLDKASFRAYLQYLQQGLFADCAPPPELETVHRLFQRMALGVEGSSGGGGSGSGGGGVDGSGAQGLATEELQQRQQGQQQQGQGQEQPQGAPQHKHSYHFYGAGAGHRGLFHTDYVLLLTACAALVWLMPEALHELVSGLERAMIGAECEVSFQYNAAEQARLARVHEEGVWQKQREAEVRAERQHKHQEQQQKKV